MLDLLLVTKDVDGSVEKPARLRDADDSEVGQLRAAEADLAVLLAESDVEEIGTMLEPGSMAAVLVLITRGRRRSLRRCAGRVASS